MSFRKIYAILEKTTKDMLKNKRLFITFFIFPIMAIVFYYMIPEEGEYFSVAYLPMHLLLVSTSIMAAIISEEKEKHTLKSLIVANVKPIEYFLGIGIFVLITAVISSSLFLIVINLSLIELVRFYAMILLSTLCSMLIGAMLGLIAENQMSANALVAPVAIVLGMLPMFSAFNKTIKMLSNYVFTGTLFNIISVINKAIPIKDYLIFIANFLVLIIIFSFIYQKKKLDN